MHIGDPVVLENVLTRLRITVSEERLSQVTREVSAATAPEAARYKPLKVHLYRSFKAVAEPALLRSGQVIRLVHKEADGALCARAAARSSGGGVGEEAHQLFVVGGTASSNSFFEVENENILDGGICDWGAPFRIRHCGTGKVLAVSTSASSELALQVPSSPRGSVPLRRSLPPIPVTHTAFHSQPPRCSS